MNNQTQDQIQAAAFRGLVKHLQKRSDVQNIDLMNLSGFCRNCLSKWLITAATQQGAELQHEEAQEMVYGMPYADWKQTNQTPATQEQLDAYNSGKGGRADTDTV